MPRKLLLAVARARRRRRRRLRLLAARARGRRSTPASSKARSASSAARSAGACSTVEFGEGDAVPADAVIARLDDRDIAAAHRCQSSSSSTCWRRRSSASGSRSRPSSAPGQQDVNARHADVRQASSAAELAEATYKRERELDAAPAPARSSCSTRRARRAIRRPARAIAPATCWRAPKRRAAASRWRATSSPCSSSNAGSAEAELDELRGDARRSTSIHAPPVPTRVETQFIWPGELAQPGTPIAGAARSARPVRADLRAGRRSGARARRPARRRSSSTASPARRVPGEISFIADRANFTPEKIETRDDRLGQVYRAKVTILERRRAVPARHRRQRLSRRRPAPSRRLTPRSAARRRVAAARAAQALRRARRARRHRPRARRRAARRHRRARRRRQDDAAARAGRPARGRGRTRRACSATTCAATCAG